MQKILHITPHLGGGVGKAISTLILNDKVNLHKVVCLEEPKSKKFYNLIKKKVSITKNAQLIKKELKKFTIFQIEYWPHPLLYKILIELGRIDKQILFWCHFSGRGNLKFNKELIRSDILKVLTTPISKKIIKKNFSIISSATVLEDKKKKIISTKKKNFFYVGSLHPAKIHNEFLNVVLKNIKYLEEFDIYGENNLTTKYKKIVNKNKDLKNKIKVFGFQNNIIDIYKKYRYLVYLLNKDHYGSAENVLIESMGMGVVPIVLNNDAEKTIIKNNYNGIVLPSVDSLKKLLMKIRKKKFPYLKIRNNCIYHAKKKYSQRLLVKKFNLIYLKLSKYKKENDFRKFFNMDPFVFYKSISNKKIVLNNDSSNKSSLKHFLKHFPKDKNLLKLKKLYKKKSYAL